MSRSICTFVASGVILLWSCPAQAWYAGGHHLIAVLAYDLLPAAEQQKIIELLRNHPRFEQDFRSPMPPGSAGRQNWWYIGRAGYWPDVALRYEAFNRPTWHYQLGATRVLGSVTPPPAPGPLPHDATLKTDRLHVAQAVELARKTLRSTTAKKSDKALANCWLAHLVGDSHQPCHAGSLYVEELFPEGDRGANLIPVGDDSNLHAFWDSQLGGHYNAVSVAGYARRVQGTAAWKLAPGAVTETRFLSPETWLKESRELGQRFVYTQQVIDAVEAARRSGRQTVESLRLADQYQLDAARISLDRAAMAAHRLAAILRLELADGTRVQRR